MSRLNQQEQETLEKLKHFWSDWNKYIVGVVAGVAVLYAGNSVYHLNTESKAKQAASLYAEFNSALTMQDLTKANAEAVAMQNKISGNDYTAMASLDLAKAYFDAKKFPEALKLLLWVKDNASTDVYKNMALLRLASVYEEQGDFDKAREVLLTKHNSIYDPIFYDARGDMYLAKGDIDKAKDAYKQALKQSQGDQGFQQTVQMKLNVIGG